MAYRLQSTGGAGGSAYGAGGAGGTFGMEGGTAEYKQPGFTGGGGGGGAGAAGGAGGATTNAMGGAGGSAGTSNYFSSGTTTDGGNGQGLSQTIEFLGGGGGGGGGNGVVLDITGPSNALFSVTGGNGGAGYSFAANAPRGGGGGGGGAGGDGFVVRSATSTSGISGNETGGNGGAGGAGFIGVGAAGDGGDGGAGVSIGAAATGFYVLLGDSRAMTGGNGGLGGLGGYSTQTGGSNSVGRGGNGGAGVAMNNGGSIFNYATVKGGNGAASAGSLTDPDALHTQTVVGAAGTGGAGVAGSNATIYMRGGTITGGMGGAGGTAGAGGAGILGSNLTVDASSGGTISGGMSGDNATQADAITFTGGTGNRLTLGGTLNGQLGVTGTLTFVTFGNTALTNVIHDTANGAGKVAYSGGDVLTLSGKNTYTGGTSLTGGVLVLNHQTGGTIDAAGSGEIRVGPGKLRFDRNGALGNALYASTGSVIAAKTGVTATFNGFISTAGSVVFGSSADRGTIVLAESTFAIQSQLDSLAVEGGTLKAGGGALGAFTARARQTVVRQGATLDFNGSTGASADIANLSGKGTITNSAGATTTIDFGNFAGVLAGAGDLEVDGSVTLYGVSTLTGTVSVDAYSTLKLASTASFDNAAGITDNGTLRLSGTTLDTAVTGSGRVVGTGTLAADGNGSAIQYVADGVALTFTGDNTFGGTLGGPGTIALNAGTDTFAAGLKLTAGTIALGGADVTLGANNSVARNFDASAGTLDLEGHNLTLSGAASLEGTTIIGGGALLTNGVTNVRADTSISARLGNGGTLNQRADLTFGANGYLTNAVGAATRLLGNFDITASCATNNAGLIEKATGLGTSTISGGIANSGTIEVDNGTLVLTGNVSGTGGLDIERNSTLDLGAVIAAGQTVSFGSGNGTLELDAARSFRGSISGFNAGDTIGLTGFSENARLMYEAATGGGGTLSVVDGANRFSAHLNGSYNGGGFSLMQTAEGEAIHYAAQA